MVKNVIIMAGGEGRRLRPLTEHRPKPLMPLLDEPVIGMLLRLLRRHGIREATLTLCYRAEDVMQALGDGSAYGVHLRYAVEKNPRGTAGSVADAAAGMQGTVLVLSGDCLTDVNLTEFYRRHGEQGGVMSLAVKPMENPEGYGLCEMDGKGRILHFAEKPEHPPEKAWVNMGIYLMEPEAFTMIPEEGMVDFGRDVLPGLVAAGKKVQAIETEGYWCDIGSREAYCQAQLDILAGKVALPVRGRRVGKAILGQECQVAENVSIAGRCYLGDHVQISQGCVVGGGTVIRSGAVVGPGVHLENACLWENASIDGGTILKNVVVMPHGGHRGLQRVIPVQGK